MTTVSELITALQAHDPNATVDGTAGLIIAAPPAPELPPAELVIPVAGATTTTTETTVSEPVSELPKGVQP